MNTYSTRNECIQREIIDVLEAGDVQDAREEFDIDSIADAVVYSDGKVFYVHQGPHFWHAVEYFVK